jgi:cytochrome c-type biogenesis protein CcmH/NrfF
MEIRSVGATGRIHKHREVDLSKRQTERAARRRGKTQATGFDFVKVLPILFGLAAVVVIFALTDKAEPPEHVHDHGPQALTPTSDPGIQRIVSQFDCPCDQCEHTLAECTCEHPRGSKEVKGFITHELLHAGRSEEEVVKLVEEKYGHRITM